MKAIYVVALLAVVFVLAYNPKTRRVENFMQFQQPKYPGPNSQCCSKNKYVANNPTQCTPAHYQGVQFADNKYGCPVKHPEAYLGAIIGR